MNNLSTRTEIESSIVLTEEDKIRNVKFMKIQEGYSIKVSFFEENEIKMCSFLISKDDKWKISYKLPLSLCFDYKKILEQETEEEYKYYHSIFKDLKMILISELEEEEFLEFFEYENEDEKNKILMIRNNVFIPILEEIKEEIGEEQLSSLRFALSTI